MTAAFTINYFEGWTEFFPISDTAFLYQLHLNKEDKI